ncbi:hypothetical protein DPMN_015072 [Dreissena polymorpha]|uniref:Uncharacterized protein n=1 Tax=Dreissena polymorpha TaxID=45954 RepID=A0A9D4NAW4_DREPO|nr:hypothetical protein DPMN_015072 [Dreissena polymorpha]
MSLSCPKHIPGRRNALADRFVSQTPVTSIGVDTSSGKWPTRFSSHWLSTGRPVCDQRQPHDFLCSESSVRTSSGGR